MQNYMHAIKIYPPSEKVLIKQFFLPCLSWIDFKTRCIMKHILNTEPDGYEKKSTDVKTMENIMSSVHKISECNGRKSTKCCHKISLNVGPQVRKFKYFNNNKLL